MIFLVIGVLLSIVGTALLLSFVFSRIRCNTEVTAAVAKVATKSFFWRGRTIGQYTPFVEYTFEGKKYSGKADLSSNDPKRFSAGMKVRIFVNKKSPSEFRLGGNAGILISGAVLTAAGIFACVCFFL